MSEVIKTVFNFTRDNCPNRNHPSPPMTECRLCGWRQGDQRATE